MHIKLFVKDNCPKCPAAKMACEGLEMVQSYNLGDPDGLAEAAFYCVMSTPTVLVVADDGSELAGWRGEAPDRVSLRAAVAN